MLINRKAQKRIDMKQIEGTKWLITGGTSGLGLALVKRLVSRGARVAVVARNEDKLSALAKELPIIPITGDISSKDDTYKIAGQALSQLGGLDALVNNASSLGATPLRPLLDTDCEDFGAVLETNLVGAFRLTKAVLPTFLLKGGGTVINISSDAAVSAYPNWGAYSVSKAALDHLSHIWGEEMRAHGITFLSVDPGDMDTPMHAAAVPEADPATLKKPEIAAEQLLELLDAPPGWQRRSL